jgi:hypothetical protein
MYRVNVNKTVDIEKTQQHLFYYISFSNVLFSSLHLRIKIFDIKDIIKK